MNGRAWVTTDDGVRAPGTWPAATPRPSPVAMFRTHLCLEHVDAAVLEADLERADALDLEADRP